MMRPALLFSLTLALQASAAPVVGIADGDTLTVLEDRKQVKIRLGNIDAPERKQVFGERSRQSLAEMCFRKDATYQTQTIDRYGRIVAVVTCDGVEANRAQVSAAWHGSMRSTTKILPCLPCRSKPRPLNADCGWILIRYRRGSFVAVRAEMPRAAALIGLLREVFGRETIDDLFRRGMKGDPVFFIREGDRSFGTKLIPGDALPFDRGSLQEPDVEH